MKYLGPWLRISLRGQEQARDKGRRVHSYLPLVGDRMEDTYPKLALTRRGRGGQALGTRDSRSLIGKSSGVDLSQRMEDIKEYSGDDNDLIPFIRDAQVMHPLGNPKGRWTFVLKPRLKLNRKKTQMCPQGLSGPSWGLLKMINRWAHRPRFVSLQNNQLTGESQLLPPFKVVSHIFKHQNNFHDSTSN